MIWVWGGSPRGGYFVAWTWLGVSDASLGIMYVASRSVNIAALPLNASRAKAYAARIEVVSSPTVTAIAMMNVLVKNRAHGASPHAVAKFSRWASCGNSVGGNVVASKKLLNAVESIQ